MKRALALCAVVLSACATAIAEAPPPCASDSDCPSGNICFAEGCGDPGTGIVVEVEGSALTSFRARDFGLADGTLLATYDFQMGEALALTGQLQRELSTGVATDRTSYTEGVVVRAVGTSTLLPGITRTFETRFDKPEFGFFEMNVGAGNFTLIATPIDARVPPVSSTAVVGGAATPSVTFAFPAVDGAPALSGQLLRTIDKGEALLISQPYTATGAEVPTIDLQLFDAANNHPLSQRFPIGTTTGEFAITVSPDARTRKRLVLVATPREPGVAIPTKRFELETPLPPAVSLWYGDYGRPAEVVGQIVDRNGGPIAGAHVVLEGVVGGDGTFRSKIVQTNELGEFKVMSLPSQKEGSFTLSVVPPESSAAAYTRRTVTVISTSSGARLEPARISLEERLVVKGSVVGPSGDAAANVSVTATLQGDNASLSPFDAQRSLPVEPTVTTTDAEGHFELRLDPGTWRFNYQPSDALPAASRLVTVEKQVDDQGNELSVQTLSPVQLSSGRRVSGSITASRSGKEITLPFSQVRFFRVTTIGGKPASIPLATTIADETGRYTTVLPSVMSTAARNKSP